MNSAVVDGRRWAARSPSSSATLRGTRTAVIGVAALLLAQARWAGQHGDAPPPDLPVDLLVRPPAGTLVVGPTYRLAALGDSGMSGVGAGDLEGVLSVQVAQRLAVSLGRSVHVTSFARAGARTADVLGEQVPRLTAPDGVVLLVGTNDVVHHTPLPALRRQTAALLDALVAADAPVTMSSLPEFRAMRLLPRPLRDTVSAYAGLIDAVQRGQAASRPTVQLVDVRRRAGPAFLRQPAAMSADGFHPSRLGYSLIADVLAPAVAATSRAGGSDVDGPRTGVGRDPAPAGLACEYRWRSRWDPRPPGVETSLSA